MSKLVYRRKDNAEREVPMGAGEYRPWAEGIFVHSGDFYCTECGWWNEFSYDKRLLTLPDEAGGPFLCQGKNCEVLWKIDVPRHKKYIVGGGRQEIKSYIPLGEEWELVGEELSDEERRGVQAAGDEVYGVEQAEGEDGGKY